MLTRTGNLTFRQLLGLMRQVPGFAPVRPYGSVARMQSGAEPSGAQRPSSGGPAKPARAPDLDPKLIRAHLAAATESAAPRFRQPRRRKVRR